MTTKRRKSKKHRCLTCGHASIAIDFSTYNDGFWKGIEEAASFIEQFDDYVNHDWRLSDCIRFKFNAPGSSKRKIRKNSRKHVIVGKWNV